MRNCSILSALGTPLDDDEHLHFEGLERHLEEQWLHGMDGVFVAGSMGLMQLLHDATYIALVKSSVSLSQGRGELFVGVGDTSLARTRERIDFVNNYNVDGIVVITPYFLKFSQDELQDYFLSLASISQNPLYIYDIPVRTGVKLEFPLVERLAKHPNIHGIKCSCDLEWTLELRSRVGDQFRIIAVAIDELEVLFRVGVTQYMDGLFAMMPHWTGAMKHAVIACDWLRVSEFVRGYARLLEVARRFGSHGAYTVVLNARGIPGKFTAAPLRPLIPTEQSELLQEVADLNNKLEADQTILQDPIGPDSNHGAGVA